MFGSSYCTTGPGSLLADAQPGLDQRSMHRHTDLLGVKHKRRILALPRHRNGASHALLLWRSFAALFFPSCRRMLSIAQDLRPRRPCCLSPARVVQRRWTDRQEGLATSGLSHAVPLYETEAMAKRIAAEGSRPVLGVFEHLLLLGTRIERPRQSRLKIVDMNVEMHGRPVSLVSARFFGVSRGSGACPFL